MENQIMAEHLSFHYTDEEGKVVSPEILKDLSLTFQPGSFASVFSILRSKKLNLKGGLASLLEIESGSNDPVSYMMTIIILTIMSVSSDISLPWMIAKQLLFGFGIGFGVAFLSSKLLSRINFEINGMDAILVIGTALFTYGFSSWLGGNGYLSVYIVGIVLGNSKILHKTSLVHFFDGITWLMQIAIFFVLGLLAFPSKIPLFLPHFLYFRIF